MICDFPANFIQGTIRDIVALANSGRLFRVALGIIFFWSIAWAAFYAYHLLALLSLLIIIRR